LPLTQAGPLASVSLDPGDDPLRLRGHWDLTLDEHASGQIAIDRESGDLRPSLEASAPTALGLRELSAQVQLDDGQLRAQLSMDSERAGSVKASAQAAVQRGQDRSWGLDPSRPWHVGVTGWLPAIEALEPFFPQQARANLRIAGRLAVSLRIDGTPGEPQASGRIEGDDLRLAWIDQGIRLQDGRLRARVERDRMQIEELRFEGPLRVAPADRRARDAVRGNPVGSVSASGQVGLSDLAGSLQVQARQLPVLQRSDRWLLVSGDGKVELAPHRVSLNATLAADAGFVDLSRTDIPTLSDDVHVIQPSRAPAAPTPGVTIAMNLAIDLGSAFYLRGNGLDARITGPLRLQGEGHGPLRVNGAVSIEQEGFGQRLSIRYGRVNFQGYADNPGLDVLAVRTDLPVEVGVAVTGSVTRPIVRLHSDPPLPDYEALTWLALGRAPSDPRTDNVALARLATGLLSGSGEGIPTRLARSIGIDEINLRSADAPANGTLLPRQSVAGKLTADETTTAATATNQIISLGHRINDAITVSYEQTVSGASNVVQVSYQLSRRLSLIGRAGSDNALNLVFSLPFD
jgi:translocation and assembly module TamB